MKYKVRMMSWSKRRPIDKTKKIVNVELEGFSQIHNHFCKMFIQYDTSEEKIELNGRVLHNKIKDTWIVNAMNSKGDSCTIDIISF